MRFDIVTIFPEFFSGPLDYGILRRARETGLVDIRVQDLRAYTHDRHRTVDDRPFGGGEGMVLKPEPLFEAVESLLGCAVPKAVPAPAARDLPEPPSGLQTDTGWPPSGTAVVLLSASGRLFRQATAACLAGLDRVVLLCGRYEGVDERVAEHLASHELSIGDFVLSGGELAAALIVEAVTRLVPGALGNEASAVNESFSMPGSAAPRRPRSATEDRVKTVDDDAGLLDCPHYTRPAEFRGWPVPEILLGGNHEEIRLWRRQTALEKTRRNRPDLL